MKEIGLRKAIFFWEEDDFEWESFVNLRVHCSQTCLHFYAQLIKEDKDVAYYGKLVNSKDVDTPLMRWKISDDEYRVIFGDLSVEDVSETQLDELEADLDKSQLINLPTPKF